MLIFTLMIIFLIIISLPFLGWFLALKIYDYLFSYKEKEANTTINYHNYYDNRSVTIQQKEDRSHLD